jgi:hypothetical protein
MTVAAAKSNGDLTLTPIRGPVYMGTDLFGGFRQVCTIAQAASQLAHSSPIIAGVANAAISIGLCLTGTVCMLTAAVWTIPDAYNSYKTVSTEIELTQLPPQPEESAEETASKLLALEEAKKALPIAKLGLANQGLYFGMGAAQFVAGVIDLCSPATAQILHYAPAMTGTAASTAAMASGIALGAVYVIRGSVMMVKSIKSARIVHAFEEELKTETGKSIKAAVDFMKKEEKKGAAYLGRRLDMEGLEEAKNDIEYLKAVDKGIYTEKLKHNIAIIIATAMIIGGILAIAAACLCPGTLPLIAIMLISAVFFLSVESVFLTYDSSKIFIWLRNTLYEESSYLTDAINKHRGIEPKPPVEIVNRHIYTGLLH